MEHLAPRYSLIDIVLNVAVAASILAAGYFAFRSQITIGQPPLRSQYTPLLLHQLTFEELPTYAPLKTIAEPDAAQSIPNTENTAPPSAGGTVRESFPPHFSVPLNSPQRTLQDFLPTRLNLAKYL